MARWRGIFGRKGKRDAEPAAESQPVDDPGTAVHPWTGKRAPESAPPAGDPYGTGDWERVPETDTNGEDNDESRPVVIEPDTGTAEWAPPSPVAGRRREPEPPSTEQPLEEDVEPAPDAEAEVEAEPEPEPEPEPDANAEAVSEQEQEPEEEPAAAPAPEGDEAGDTGDRIRVAADDAARVAEIRSHDEIVALERNLEQEKASARAEIEDLASRLREAEGRVQQAEERAAEIAAEKEAVETRAREQATQWLRGQVTKLKAEAQQRVREEVERIRAEAAAAADNPDAAASGAEAEGLRSELQLAREEADAATA